MIAKFSRSRLRSQGFILFAVLWLLALLATLAVIYAQYVNTTAASLAVNQDYLQAQAEKNPAAFMTLLGKVLPLPLQVSGEGGSPLVIRPISYADAHASAPGDAAT